MVGTYPPDFKTGGYAYPPYPPVATPMLATLIYRGHYICYIPGYEGMRDFPAVHQTG